MPSSIFQSTVAENQFLINFPFLFQEPHTLSGNLFVNVFQWARVPAPKNDEAPIPVMGGEIYNIQDENNVNGKTSRFNQCNKNDSTRS